MGLGPNPKIYAGPRLVTTHDLSSESKGHVWHYCKDYIKKKGTCSKGVNGQGWNPQVTMIFLLTCLISWIKDNFLVVFAKLTRDLFVPIFQMTDMDKVISARADQREFLDLIMNWTLINDTFQFLKVKTMNYCFGWALIFWIRASICVPP